MLKNRVDCISNSDTDVSFVLAGIGSLSWVCCRCTTLGGMFHDDNDSDNDGDSQNSEDTLELKKRLLSKFRTPTTTTTTSTKHGGAGIHMDKTTTLPNKVDDDLAIPTTRYMPPADIQMASSPRSALENNNNRNHHH